MKPSTHDTAADLTKLAAFAFGLTLVGGGVWSALLVANLRTSPRVPWSVVVMAVVLRIAWSYLSGGSGESAGTAHRRARLRAAHVSAKVFESAALAGLLSIGSLAGLWIVLVDVAPADGRLLPDFSRYPLFAVVLIVAMGALAGAVTEEAGFRGYFQGALETRLGAPLAIGVTALVMLPAHGLTQGFAVTTVLFYLCVDAMLGVMAYLTQSILPGIAVHFIGLAAFFSLIWPFDAERRFAGADGVDAWFWIHTAQAVVGAMLAVLAFRRLARLTAPLRARA